MKIGSITSPPAQSQTQQTSIERRRIRLNGIVQGVGFRPFVYQLATAYGLAGFVQNDSLGLLIEVQGGQSALAQFEQKLLNEPPALARIHRQQIERVRPLDETCFTIRTSAHEAKANTSISPDSAVCPLCLAEMQDPHDRRFSYPFINCTHCGPRFTIIHALPYDRPNTSMSVFQLCADCEREYRTPEDRRFHAQPTACPVCGPRVWLCNAEGRPIDSADPFLFVIEQLQLGAIIAIRGLGGFHLCADAKNSHALSVLRERKGRAQKPFAVMARDMAVVEQHGWVADAERALLQSPARPIVLLKKKVTSTIAAETAPGNRYLGMMLPYTPLHHRIFAGELDCLVMTSANLSEEPIAISNQEALDRLAQVADFFLLHDREILQRCDDSVARVVLDKPRMIRRSRGYVPEPLSLPTIFAKPILACGGELKNTIALARDNQVYLSQHIGDLDNPLALHFFHHALQHLQIILEIEPEFIVCDLHPDYLSSQWAREQKEKPVIAVQHHHAHLASVMAENHISQPCVGIILDGTGYGLDGTIWGGEVLTGDHRSFKRFAWLQPVAMPGAEAAIRQPWRMAFSHLFSAFGAEFLHLNLAVIQQRSDKERAALLQMLEKQANTPITSSCGRLFDAVGALLGLTPEISYEAQTAVELETLADEQMLVPYPQLHSNGQGILPTDFLMATIVSDLLHGVEPSIIAARFHSTLAELFVQASCAAREKLGLNLAALSGGVFQNRLLFTILHNRLMEEGFEVISHSRVPTNDGGLALGQAFIAAAQMAG